MKDIRISVRVPKELKERLQRAEQTTGIDEGTLVRNCVNALLDEIERTGQITFPLEVMPKKKASAYPQRDEGEVIRVEDGKRKRKDSSG